MKKTLLAIAAVFSTLCAVSQSVGYEPGEIMVMLKTNDDAKKLVRDLTLIGIQKSGIAIERQVVKRMNLWLFKFDHNTIDNERMLDYVRSKDYVILAQFNHTGIELRGTAPNDSLYSKQWNHKNTGQNNGKGIGCDIDSEVAWDVSTGGLSAAGDTIVVANVDGGDGRGHEDLKYWNNYFEIPGNSIDDDGNGYVDDFKGWNVITHDDNVTPDAHALQCAGIIGARGNNKKGISGVNWDVQIMGIEALWSSSATPNATKEAMMVEGYGYLIDQRDIYNKTNGAKGAFVVASNSSFGVDGGKAIDFPIWCALYDSLGKVGILNSSACTNKNTNADNGDMPTVCPSDYIIPVMSSTYEDKIPTASFGSSVGMGYGPKCVDLAAPTGMLSTVGTNKYSSTATGTSFSAPHVAGVISLLVAGACPMLLDQYKQYPDSTLKLFKKFILDNVDKPAAFNGKNATNGRLNAGNAMKAMDAYCTALSANTKINGDLKVKAMFPNPASDELYINLGNADLRNVTVAVTDLCGKIIYLQQVAEARRNTNIKIPVSNFPAGYYLVSVSDKSGVYNNKFVKE